MENVQYHAHLKLNPLGVWAAGASEQHNAPDNTNTLQSFFVIETAIKEMADNSSCGHGALITLRHPGTSSSHHARAPPKDTTTTSQSSGAKDTVTLPLPSVTIQ